MANRKKQEENSERSRRPRTAQRLTNNTPHVPPRNASRRRTA